MSGTQRTSRTRRTLVRLAWTLGAALLALLLLRTFVLGVYRVDSGSMEPFLHGTSERGELVLVLYRRRPPVARFDPIVILRPGERDPVVKRIAGLSGESVQLSSGDLFIDGRRIDPSVARPSPVKVYDLHLRPLAEAFQLIPDVWSAQDDIWHLDARAVEPASAAVCAVWTNRLLDEWLDEGGAPARGRREVGDGLLELELLCEQAPGRVVLRLSEEGDRFDLELDLAESGRALGRIVRRAGGADEVLAEGELDLTPGGWHRLRFANVDNSLSVDLDGACAVLQAEYERNTRLSEVPDEGYHHLKPRASFGAAGLVLSLRGVRLLRDLHYTERGAFGVERALLLGPDEIFVLGDNSADSLDSRDFGPVPLDQVIGVPLAVIWPPGGWRWLTAPGSRGGGTP